MKLSLRLRRSRSRFIAAVLGTTLVVGVLPPLVLTAAATVVKTPVKMVYVRPDAVSAMMTARAQHHRVQVESLNTESTTTYATPRAPTPS